MTFPIVFYKTNEFVNDPLHWPADNREYFLRRVEITLNREFFWYNKESVSVRGSLFPNFMKTKALWDILPSYHREKLPTNYTVKRQRLPDNLSSDEDEYMKGVTASGGDRLQKPPEVIPCRVTMTQDCDSGDSLSDDDFQLTDNSHIGATKKRISRDEQRTPVVTSVGPEASIWKDITADGVPLISENNTDNADICRPARCLPVFVGLLSLAAVPACRILTSTDLDNARYWSWYLVIYHKLLLLTTCVTNTRYKQIRWLSGTKEQELCEDVPNNYTETYWNLGEA